MMNKNEINIGDGVFFLSTITQSNYGVFWTVKSKSIEGSLLIEVDVDDLKDITIIKIEDVTQLISSNTNIKKNIT